MSLSAQDEQREFENHVRRIARELWPDAAVAGATMADGQERDGLFETEDCIHLLEVTTSRQKAKAEADIEKLVRLANRLRKQQYSKSVRCWFVTRDDPTADQQAIAYPHRQFLTSESFTRFQSRLIDAVSYLSLREKYPFGSVRDPVTGRPSADIDYINLDLMRTGGQEAWTFEKLLQEIDSGQAAVLLGDFGAGKSMTLLQLHKNFRQNYLKGRTTKFPVYVNLRDHIGQDDAVEILERHAKRIGFAKPHHLVRAWRAGYVILLVDGFDEITILGIQGIWRKLHDSRYRAMKAVRELIRDQPVGAGFIISGRAHFFDNERERRNALGLTSRFIELSLNEFSEAQIKDYLEKLKFVGAMPTWLPTRPLLVGYLAARGFLVNLAKNGRNDTILTDPAAGWDYLLDNIAAREAEIEPGIDAPTIRRLLERLATIARSTQSGLGPLAADQIVGAFEEICGYKPDEKAMILLQRLPGLGVERVDENTRSFIDPDLADACRAGDIVHYILEPYNFDYEVFRNMEYGCGLVGIPIVGYRFCEGQFSEGKLNAALKRAQDVSANVYLLADLVHIATEVGANIAVAVFINGAQFQELVIQEDGPDLSQVCYQDCFFSVVELAPEVNVNNLPRFESCYFGQVEGRVSIHDLPNDRFDSTCVYDGFGESASTTNAIVDMHLPLGTRVLLTILKKLYLQKGSGRRENALFRGLDHHGKRLVPGVLRLLKREGLAIEYDRGRGIVWLPVRGKMERVGRIIKAPVHGTDSLIKASAEIL